MIAWILALGVPERLARPLLIALGVFAAVTALGLAKCSYDRALIEAHDARQDAATAVQARAGEAAAADERRDDDDRISHQTDEVTHATNAIPDRPTSDRQHARACVILRRQAAASGSAIPAGC